MVKNFKPFPNLKCIHPHETPLRKGSRTAQEVQNPSQSDAVYDCAIDIDLGDLNNEEDVARQEALIGEAEERASSVNNGGLRSQIEFFLEHNDEPTVEQLIRNNAPQKDTNGYLLAGEPPIL